MAPLTWKNVDAPRFGDSAYLLQGAGRSLSDAVKIFTGGMKDYRQTQKERASNELLAAMSGVDSAADVDEFVNNLPVNTRDLTPEAAAALANLRATAMGYDTERLQQANLQSQINHRGRARSGNGSGVANPTQRDAFMAALGFGAPNANANGETAAPVPAADNIPSGFSFGTEVPDVTRTTNDPPLSFGSLMPEPTDQNIADYNQTIPPRMDGPPLSFSSIVGNEPVAGPAAGPNVMTVAPPGQVAPPIETGNPNFTSPSVLPNSNFRIDAARLFNAGLKGKDAVNTAIDMAEEDRGALQFGVDYNSSLLEYQTALHDTNTRLTDEKKQSYGEQLALNALRNHPEATAREILAKSDLDEDTLKYAFSSMDALVEGGVAESLGRINPVLGDVVGNAGFGDLDIVNNVITEWTDREEHKLNGNEYIRLTRLADGEYKDVDAVKILAPNYDNMDAEQRVKVHDMISEVSSTLGIDPKMAAITLRERPKTVGFWEGAFTGGGVERGDKIVDVDTAIEFGAKFGDTQSRSVARERLSAFNRDLETLEGYKSQMSAIRSQAQDYIARGVEPPEGFLEAYEELETKINTFGEKNPSFDTARYGDNLQAETGKTELIIGDERIPVESPILTGGALKDVSVEAFAEMTQYMEVDPNLASILSSPGISTDARLQTIQQFVDRARTDPLIGEGRRRMIIGTLRRIQKNYRDAERGR